MDFGLKDPKTFPATVPHDITALRAALPPADLIARASGNQAMNPLLAEAKEQNKQLAEIKEVLKQEPKVEVVGLPAR